jgi:YVTN family beta-propeller protein
VTNFNAPTVSVIATGTNSVVASVDVGLLPFDLAMTPNGSFVYVADLLSATVSVIETANNTRVATVIVDPQLVALALRSSPREKLEGVVVEVERLVEAGPLPAGQGKALLSTLAAADRQLEGGNDNAAANLYRAFINQVRADINAGIIAPEQGQPLIDAAQNAIDQLGE